jgi:hypothetical protein
MSTKTWEVLRTCYCHHIDQQVALEALLVYPPDLLPDQSPRVLAHRCDQGLRCNLDGRPSCQWAGTNPSVDPFSETY